MSVLHLFFIVMAALVGVQVVMTRRYGWRGLAYSTTVLVCLIPAVEIAMLLAWANGRSDIILFPLALSVPLVIVLVAAILLAFFVKTE